MLGGLFVLLWFSWFRFYAIKDLSFVTIAPVTLEKISVFKFHYLGLFVGMLVWGMVLAVAPGVVSYVYLILWSILWIFLTIRKGIYRSKFNKARAIFNQGVSILIAIFYIVMEYADTGDGLPITIIIAVLLFLCLLINIVIGVYTIYISFKTKELVAKADE